MHRQRVREVSGQEWVRRPAVSQPSSEIGVSREELRRRYGGLCWENRSTGSACCSWRLSPVGWQTSQETLKMGHTSRQNTHNDCIVIKTWPANILADSGYLCGDSGHGI